MSNPMIDLILSRRSIRAYKPEQISDEALQTLLTAAEYAPSGMNQQLRKFAAVQGRDNIRNMLAAGGLEDDPFYGAPTVIVVFAQKDAIAAAECGALSMENMMLAAHALGLGSCWIHAVTRIFPTEGGKALQQQWGIPEDYFAVGSLAVGIPAGEAPDPRPRKENLSVIIK